MPMPTGRGSLWRTSPGRILRTFVSAHGPLPLAETAGLGALLAEGLGTVHEAGLQHRDLKPQNILPSRYGPKVIDFGLAVLAERRTTLTAAGFVVGSVLCMPPEQARGEHRLDRAADACALGAVLDGRKGEQGVLIGTMYRFKGLEYRCLIIADAAEGLVRRSSVDV
ncbi:protein kinase domain-containing protein [Streptomyces sp. MMS24-I29]|uniref:protein kinase domain-containing protein n=1 Tax=Streptomyces sp. MMS24-I29 TaxID=3351480 RepID=UPI003C7E37A9